MVFWSQRQRKTPLTMTISSVLPQLFGCRASVIPGLFVRPVLRPGPSPAFSGRPVLYPGHRGPPVLDPGPLHPDLAWFTPVDCIKSAPDRQGAARPLVQPDLAPIRHPADRRNTGKGRRIPPPRRGPWRMICNRGPWPFVPPFRGVLLIPCVVPGWIGGSFRVRQHSGIVKGGSDKITQQGGNSCAGFIRIRSECVGCCNVQFTP